MLAIKPQNIGMSLFFQSTTLRDTVNGMYHHAIEDKAARRLFFVVGDKTMAVRVHSCIIDIRFPDFVDVIDEDVEDAPVDNAVAQNIYSMLMCGHINVMMSHQDLAVVSSWCNKHKPYGLDTFSTQLSAYLVRVQRLTSVRVTASATV